MIKTHVCKHCNKEFSRQYYPSQDKFCTFEFCSPSCRNKSRSIDKIPCPICGTYFTPRINDSSINGISVRKRYCSSKCGNKSRIGKTPCNPAYHGKEVIKFVVENYPTRGAIWISEQLNISISGVRNLSHRLNLKLYPYAYKHLVHGKASEHMLKHNPMKNEITAKLVGKKVSFKYWNDSAYRERLLKSHSREQRKSPSKPELLCKTVLSELGIDFVHQYIVKEKFIVDFLLPNKIIIQVDGEYWHGHPRFNPLTDRQLSQQKRDESQDKYLTTCGYSVIRIWERDISKEHLLNILTNRQV